MAVLPPIIIRPNQNVNKVIVWPDKGNILDIKSVRMSRTYCGLHRASLAIKGMNRNLGCQWIIKVKPRIVVNPQTSLDSYTFMYMHHNKSIAWATEATSPLFGLNSR